jgi:hypothetical protein
LMNPKNCLLTAKILVLCGALAHGAGISTRTINPTQITTIVLSQNDDTTIIFPEQISGVYCKGIVLSDSKEKKGLVQGFWSANKPVLVLTSLVDPLNAKMTVYMGGKLYAFNLITGQNPDVAMTLESGDPSPDPDKPAPTEKMVLENRVNYDPHLLVSLMDKARGAFLQRKASPEDYKGYEHRNVAYMSYQSSVNTEVTDVHRFPDSDAIVLEGKVTNLTSSPVSIRTAMIAMGSEGFQRQATFWYCPRPIPPNASENVVAELIGGIDGLHGDLLASQQYRIIIDEPTKGGPVK